MDLIEKIKVLQNHLAVGNLKNVIEGCSKILKKTPNNAFVLNLCGLAFQKNRQIKLSVKYFIGALDQEPNNIAAINNLANSYKALGRIELAEKLYKKAIDLNPGYINALNNYGNLKLQLNDFKEATDLFKKAIVENKNEITLLFGLASALQGLGNFDEATKVLKRILIIDPKKASAHKMISSILNYDPKNEESKIHLEEMKKLILDKSLNDDQKIDLSFALAKAFEEMGSFDSSFQNLTIANFLKKKKFNYNLGNDEKLFNSIIKVFENIDFDRFKKRSENKEIIFICGMPRSGTTLVEQIIASHKEVYGAGELIYLQDVLQKNFIEDFRINKQRLIDQASLPENNVANEYFKKLNDHKFDSKRTTDKAPQNFRWIGFIKIFFPNSKIIHCKRNPKDNCLSLFKNSFASPSMNWSYDQTDVARYYNLYDNLMLFWKKKIPNFIYDVKYEDLVSNHEVEIKKLIKFCNLDWDPSCLNYYKNNKTPIQTVSVNQARKPIYNTSVNSNTNFKKYLQEMYNILDTH
ncbi:sulfotransferase [Candidatus Pelagibacter sp. Uisw_099_02]|uniref:tetratricopeptide repeat-containing sulfotransferase family protein n=1 Tax=Candidatus Pelagibacter sp. Uisw_099_02 TaxID=3230981 RepID=UPI0023726768|nr:sulfotransferase [Candidatus Pelagibacter sp.]|tara:strand:+ start:285 stop:1850 length:1566 start_codon:yes stop_codon:yes gene_type:complete